jgi:hypothetical protein
VRMTFAYARERDPAESSPIAGGIGADGRWDPDASDGGTA